MKKLKKTVLKSFLFICLGLTITTLVFAGVRKIEPPSPPGRPEAVDISATKCTIKYLAPLHDGGAPIKMYFIECIADTWGWDTWKKKGTSPSRQYTVSNMVTGSKAAFRVSAENKAGFGRPSEPGDYITFKDPFPPK